MPSVAAPDMGLTPAIGETNGQGYRRRTCNFACSQPPLTASRWSNRRCYLRVTSGLPPASGMAAAPSPAGRRILALIAELQTLDAVWESNPDAASVRSLEVSDAIEVTAKSVTSRPIASLSDIVDRAILAAWAGLTHEGDDIGGLKNAYVADVLALAGIRPEQCTA